jgi:valyl-tRNA synthetase
MRSETSTCDCWVDSSITPLIISGWPDEKKMERLYPVSLRPQGVEIVRTWAFYTVYRSGVALTSLPPFKTILLNGNVLAPDGKKMSKSLGNIISPSDLLKDYPTDAIRQWAALSGAMAKDRPFSFEDIKYAKSFLSKIWNAARFVETLGKPAGDPEPTMTDRWIIGRLNSVIKTCTNDMEKFEYHHAMKTLQDFFWHDFCDNYLEYVKHRVYGENPTREAALHTLNRVLLESLKLLAPITPHISEEIFSSLYGKPSIHGENWPSAGNEYSEDVRKVDVLNKVVSEIRQHKSRNKLPQNAELDVIRLSLPEEMDAELLEELRNISKIKKIEMIKGEFSVTAG